MKASSMLEMKRCMTAAAVLACLVAGPAAADLSIFAAAVSFDDEANLSGAPGIGLRWGKSSGILGGETSLMLSRPDREVGSAKEAANVIFYEARFLLNIPMGDIKPFVGVGYGAITILPGKLEIPGSGSDDVATLDALSKTETNQAFSYGAGVRYALNERIDWRFDVRQYQVFSVKGAVINKALEGTPLEGTPLEQPEENTVTYGEMSAGVVFRF